ncbi:MAG TPA: PIN domain-containing protein [Aquella sp.]|nr:PIN domain-containing protein [Aquella sp.]
MTSLVAVLDTSALLAYLKGEPGAELIETVVDNSIMSVINITEAIIVLSRKIPDKLGYFQMTIDELVEHKYETDSKLMMLASEISVKYREKHNLSLGDCYCLALGKFLNLPVYTGDRIWLGLENKIGLKIKFIR